MRNKTGVITIIVIFFILFLGLRLVISGVKKILSFNDGLNILSSYDNKDLEDDIKLYAKENGFSVDFTYMGDLDIIDELNVNADRYDAVWIANSLWLYMVDEDNLTSEAKSISISPVVMGIKKSKAQELGLINRNVTNEDILNLVRDKKISYVMSSVTQTNDGASSYLGFLNALAGNPVLLTEEMLDDSQLINKMRDLFKGVNRVSGDEDFLEEMFLKDDKNEAVIASESSLININNELIKQGKETLYLLYPIDGVPINDSTLAFIDHYENDDIKENYLKLQKYLRSKEGQNKLKALGRRTWYGGITKEENPSFKKDWGIDTNKYLTGTKFPAKKVITKAINIYIEQLRKPSHTVFCLDYSGSMYGDGIRSLRNAMNYILSSDQAKLDKLQFSSYDKITIIPFSSFSQQILNSTGDDAKSLYERMQYLMPNGGTAIYDCSQKALEILDKETDDYTKTVILMTDGENNVGTYDDFVNYYSMMSKKIPVYGITFGDANEYDLNKIALLTNAKVFDGRRDLLKAFKEVRGYN